jgi:hypothetical protein
MSTSDPGAKYTPRLGVFERPDRVLRNTPKDVAVKGTACCSFLSYDLLIEGLARQWVACSEGHSPSSSKTVKRSPTGFF